MELIDIVNDFGDALKEIDSEKPKEGKFQPGIGPHTEDHSREMVIKYLKSREDKFQYYSSAASMQYPNSREMCDILIPNEWAIELKLLRPFGDNDKEAEHWSNKILHPYYGNTLESANTGK
jgi:hypothetical protein